MTDTPRDFTTGDAPSQHTPRAGAGWGWIMASGILSVVLGILAFLQPFAATWAATLVTGAFLFAGGALSIGAGLFGRGYERRGYLIGFGILSVLAGLLIAFNPLTGALSLTLVVASWLAVRGIMEIGLGARMKRARGMMIGLGVINIVLAAVVLATLPWSALTLPGFVLGVSFLMGGVTSIVSATHHRKGAKAFGLPG